MGDGPEKVAKEVERDAYQARLAEDLRVQQRSWLVKKLR